MPHSRAELQVARLVREFLRERRGSVESELKEWIEHLVEENFAVRGLHSPGVDGFATTDLFATGPDELEVRGLLCLLGRGWAVQIFQGVFRIKPGAERFGSYDLRLGPQAGTDELLHGDYYKRWGQWSWEHEFAVNDQSGS